VSQAGYGPGSKTFSSVTEIGVWRTSCHPSLKQRMLTWQKCWLYGWFLAGGCEVRFQCQHSALSSSAYATLQTDTDKFAKLQLRFRIASAQPCFLTLCEIATLIWDATHTMGLSHTSRQGGVKRAVQTKAAVPAGMTRKTKLSPSAEMVRSTPLVQHPAVNCRQLC